MKTQPLTLSLVGRRWFDGSNTYHTVSIVADGVAVHKSPVTYGYGQQYEETAAAYLESIGTLQREHYSNGPVETLWRACERLGISFTSEVVDVARKKDL